MSSGMLRGSAKSFTGRRPFRNQRMIWWGLNMAASLNSRSRAEGFRHINMRAY